jgi:class 3 adenylate cyclase
MSGAGSSEPPESGGAGFAGAGADLSLPGGTITFAFTDIAGSTKLLERLGDRYADALADHRRILREEFGSRGGREIDTQGDAFFFGFQRARDAVAAAVAGQKALAAHPWPDGAELLVRMSLHTGEPVVGEEGYVGIDVHRASRICSAGHGGQVLLSATTAALVAGGLPDGVEEVELGEVRLKDLDRPERLYQLQIDGLPRTFPPLRADAEEPMDFGDRLAARIEAHVERQIEASFERSDPTSVGMAGSRLAAFGLLNLVLLAVAIVVIVLLIRLVF